MSLKLPLYIIQGLHYAFLVAVLVEHSQSPYHLLLLILAIFIMAYAYTTAQIQSVTYTLVDALTVVFVLIGGLGTFALTQETGFNSVFSASLLGLIGAFIPKRKLLKEAPAALYCGTFIGMTSSLVSSGYLFIAFASVLGGLLYIICKPVLHGFGGKLGTIAFGSVAIATLLIYLAKFSI